MINPINLKKIEDIINSEGSILSIHRDPKNNFFIRAKMENEEGMVYFDTNKSKLKKYLNSVITLNKLFELKTNYFLKTKTGSVIKTFIGEDFKCNLIYGEILYKSLPKEVRLKSKVNLLNKL